MHGVMGVGMVVHGDDHVLSGMRDCLFLHCILHVQSPAAQLPLLLTHALHAPTQY